MGKRKYVKGDLRRRLMSYRAVDPETGCWNWTGSTRNGYGQIRVTGKPEYAHRLILALEGWSLDAFYVCHVCDNPLCFNPQHLFIGTQKDNVADAIAKGHSFGRGPQKLTLPDVRNIRAWLKQGRSNWSLAAQFGVDPTTISDIKLRRTWRTA